MAQGIIAQEIQGVRSDLKNAPLVVSTTASQLQGKQWNILLLHQEAETEMYPDGCDIEATKRHLASLRDNSISTPTVFTKKTRANAPTIGKNFVGTKLHSMAPADNAFGISNGGKIVCADNWNLMFADTNGTVYKDSIVWNDFFANRPEFQNGVYDPRVLYDNIADRFIVIICGSYFDSAQNKIIVAFSKTNDPMMGWNIYSVPGNPLQNGCWSDYPSVGMNDDELFISTNLFKSVSPYNYNQAVIYQIKKDSGYFAGNSIQYKLWSGNIKISANKPAFTIAPTTEGFGKSYSAGMWLVSQWPDQDNKVTLFRITGSIADSTSQLISTHINVPNYSVCADGFIYDPASNIKDSISTGSSIVQNAFVSDSFLHYTFAANIYSWCGIHYGRINLFSNTANVKSFGLQGTDLSYPSVAAFGHNSKDKSVVIGYLRADTTRFPCIEAVSVDNDFMFSPNVLLRKGDTMMDILTPPQYVGYKERWGDYTSIQKKYNNNYPEVWFAGSYAANNSRPNATNTWLSQLINKEAPLQLQNPLKNSESKPTVFPNPGYQQFWYKFNIQSEQEMNISIFDINGKKVKELLDTEIEKGDHEFSFNKGMLPSGNYILKFAGENYNQAVPFVVQ
jgi:hypothetical protein